MAMLIKNKNLAFSLILMCLIVVSPVANAQVGVVLGGTNVVNVQGLVTCSINGSVSTNATVIPPFAVTTTGANGVFSFPSNTILPISLSTLLASGCRVIVTTPLSRCNASLPTNGLLTAPINLAGTTINRGITILQFVNGLFGLI
ncbi:hypothetical protein Bca4012_066652 [Brassica carinata]